MPNAIAGVTSSTPPASSRAGGASFLRVVSNAELDAQEQERLTAQVEAGRRSTPQNDLGSFVRQRWMVMRNHRNQGNDPLNYRLLRAQRMFEGKYDPDKLREIKKFGGSEVYSRIVAVKCRGATSLLRDVYLGADRPWDIEPQPDPPVPPDVRANIIQLVSAEVVGMSQAGQKPTPDQLKMRYQGLMHAAQQAARRNATQQANAAADKINDILLAGGFYDSLAKFLVDLPLFPFACIKGPVVRMAPKLTWTGGRPLIRNVPQMFWERIDPFNLYWSPGASCIEEAEIIERKRLTRSDLNALIGLPGYDEAAVRGALQDYDNGLRDWLDYPDTEEALNQGRENPYLNLSHMIDTIEYHGNVQGRMLLENGFDARLIPDLDRDYAVQTWVVGRYTLKTQLNPNPLQRHPYFVTSFEKVPGTVAGHGLPDILEDMQEVCNAALRALVNNMAIASGPQAVINEDCLSPTENADELYPWKRWKVTNDPMGNTRPPVEFFQPQSNSQELMMVYTQVSNLADDISAIPRYVTGESLSGGAGRTASGLSMLMGNSSKILQTVAANIDIDVARPLLEALYNLIMLTDTTGMLTGEEQIQVNGVNVAVQKETERQKQLQFLQITANPIDAPIVGELGRARVLRSVASNLGLPDDIVPDDQSLQQQLQAKQQLAAAQAAQGASNPEQELTLAKIENLRASALASLAKAAAPPQAMELPPLDKLSAAARMGGAVQAGRSPNPAGGAGSSGPPSAAARASGQQAPAATPAQLSDHAPPFNAFQQGPQQGVPTNG